MWGWILLAVLGAGVAVSVVHYRRGAQNYRPLSSRQPERRTQTQVPLGMEATDMRVVNAANRRNESLDRGQTNWTNRGHMAAATDVTPMPDDASYARVFHNAFLKDTKDRKNSKTQKDSQND